nr:ribonuclease H-like domain-containing protein [Tanacetum cinerariifolium]
DNPHKALKDKGIIDNGCSRHMTGNKAHLADNQEFKGGSVAFGGSNGRITGKGKIKASRVLPPKTAKEILARERERKARTTLLMAITEDHLSKFHKITDAKEMWEAIKSRFGGNDESMKMQKYILKQQFKSFYVSNSDGLHKGYDIFRSLLSQLETHGASISTEDANQNFLRSLPSSWSQVSLIMRTKPGVDTLSFDDLYNNLRVFEFYVKGSTGSSSSIQNVPFVSSDNTSSTNEVNTAYGVSTSSGHNSQREGSSLYTDELMHSFFTNQSSGPKLNHEDLEQLDERRDTGNTRHKERDNGRRPAKHDEPKAMVTIDGEGVDWTSHAEDDTEDYALMAFSSSISGSDIEFKNGESGAKTNNLTSCDSNSSVETLEFVPKLVESKPKAVSEPKVWSDAPINSDDEWAIGKLLLRPRQVVIGDPKDITGTESLNTIDNPHQTLKGKGIVDSGCSRFSWVFFLRTKDETNGILMDFIRQIKNQLNQQVKTIRCDNDTKFKNREIIEFYASKGIKREYSNARTPQQNRFAERNNMTLIEAARTMLADSVTTLKWVAAE